MEENTSKNAQGGENSMTVKPFEERNILFLVPADDNWFLNFYSDFIKSRARSYYRLNFVDFAHNYGISAVEKQVREIVCGKNIDLVIASPFATDYQLSVEFYAGLSAAATLIFFMFDDENYFDDYSKYYCQTAHAVITTDYFAVGGYKKYAIPAVMYFSSYFTETYLPWTGEKDIDVSFVGDCTKSDRKVYFEYLVQNGVNVQLYGKGTKNGYIARDKITEIFFRSKINLNFTKTDDLSWINKNSPLLRRVRQNKGRPVEVALSGSFCLSENSPAMGALFEIGREMDVFDNKEEMLQKARYYLSHQTERETIAKNAYDKALKNFNIEVNLPKAVNEALNLSHANRCKATVYLSRQFKVNAVNGLTFSMFIMARNGKIAAAAEVFSRLFGYGFLVFLNGFTCGAGRAAKRLIRSQEKL